MLEIFAGWMPFPQTETGVGDFGMHMFGFESTHQSPEERLCNTGHHLFSGQGQETEVFAKLVRLRRMSLIRRYLRSSPIQTSISDGYG